MPAIKLLFASILLQLSFMILYAQKETPNRDAYRIHAQFLENNLEIDGILDDPIWSQADIAKDFFRVLPIDTGYASAKTEVMVAYNETYLYMAITSHDTVPGRRPAESLRRDFSFGKNDNFLVFMDTYNDQTNGFSFGISAAGAQWDGIQANGGSVSLDWDCKWVSAIKNYEDRWVAEFAIPFRSIRYQDGVTEWGINFSRLDLKQNEKSSWAPVPRQFPTANLAYTGTLVFDRPPPKLGPRFSFIPYVSGRSTKDIESGEAGKNTGSIGADAKITLSTSMNLDVTINPDFSQVEVDRQVTNLDRFELFFPERRQFFLENSDLFASLGSESIRPFFSRRIGLNAPVTAGARLSGKIGESWRIGLMNMQTGSKEDISATNFSVAAVQRKIFNRSNIGVFMVNKQLTTDPNDTTFSGLRFNRVAGVDLNLANANNRWTGKVFYHQSFSENQSNEDAFAMSGAIAYKTQQLSLSFNQALVGDNYLAETGFVRRKGFHRSNIETQYKFFPSSKKIANHGPAANIDLFLNSQFELTDRELELSYQVTGLNRSSISLEFEDGFVKLQAPFDPTNTGGDSLATGSEFTWQEIALTYTSDARKLFNYELTTRYGGYFNGARFSVGGEINYRVQPFGSLAIVVSYNQITLPEPYESAELILVGPRLDLTLTDKIFITTFVQYNNQIDNLNLNFRFQWRFAPVSDLFIVYTNNSYPDGLRPKNRALVAKLSYWFN